jgi:hypothetical protein
VFLVDMNTGTWSFRMAVVRKTDKLALYKKVIVAKSKYVKNRMTNLVGSSKKCYVEPMMLMIIVKT